MIKAETRDDVLELRYAICALEQIAHAGSIEAVKVIAEKAAGGLRARVEARVLDPIGGISYEP